MFERFFGLESISPDRVHHMVQEGRAVVIDVNGRHSWLTARVPGARHLDPVEFTDGDLPPDKESSLVFYCSNPFCRKAPSAARRAKQMGYRDVKVMSAGISGWVSGELPTESGE
jgi:rhodanese-related sulfurtransferase